MKVTIELEAQDMVEGIGRTILESMQISGKVETVAAKSEPVKTTSEAVKTKPVEAESPKAKPVQKKQEKKPEPVEEVETEETVEAKSEPEKPKRTKAEIKELLTQFCMEQEGGTTKVQNTFKELGISKLSEASDDQLATIAEKLGL